MTFSRVTRNRMAHRIATRHLKAVRQMRFYHGTSFRNVKRIAKEGLVANSGAVWSGGYATALTRDQKAVFLTSDFELAARYALTPERTAVPAVVEVKITSPRRFNKLRYDPLDRNDTSWEVEESYDEEAEQVAGEIERGAKEIAQKITGAAFRRLSMSLPEDVEHLDGTNVFKLVVGHLVRLLGLSKSQRRQAMQLAQAQFGGQEWNYMEVRPDGTLKLTEEYFYTREQLMYMKGLPPKTVKGVWVRTRDFDLDASQIKATQEGGFKDLPGEAADRFRSLQELFKELRWTTPDEIPDLSEYARRAQELDYPELVDFLEEAASLDPDSLSEMEDWDDELEGLEDGLFEDWMQERIKDTGTWAKVSLRVASRLRPLGKVRAAR